MTLAVCHREGDLIVQDCLRGRRSDKPQNVVEEFVQVLKSYGVKEITGDNYSKSWVQTAFGDRGIKYNVSKMSASDAFLELLPVINQGTVLILDDKRQTAQLIGLERRQGRSGKDSLGHPPGGHDDRANSLALACADLAKPKSRVSFIMPGMDSALINGEIVTLPAAPEPTVDLYSQSVHIAREKN